jgi:hypothetical protein
MVTFNQVAARESTPASRLQCEQKIVSHFACTPRGTGLARICAPVRHLSDRLTRTNEYYVQCAPSNRSDRLRSQQVERHRSFAESCDRLQSSSLIGS